MRSTKSSPTSRRSSTALTTRPEAPRGHRESGSPTHPDWLASAMAGKKTGPPPKERGPGSLGFGWWLALAVLALFVFIVAVYIAALLINGWES